MNERIEKMVEELETNFDWVDCGRFVPSDGVVRPCHKCGILTEFCYNCNRDHHKEDKRTVVKSALRTALASAYNAGWKDMLQQIQERHGHPVDCQYCSFPPKAKITD